MAILATEHPTLKEWADSIGPNGSPAVIVNTLEKKMPMLQDAPFLESNLPTGHETTILSGLPEPTWRRLYEGIQPTKSQKVKVTDTIGNLEDTSEVDADLADLNGNTDQYRLNEAKPHFTGMAHTLGETFFYGDTDVNPERFMGLVPRYSILSDDEDNIGYNIIDAGGTGGDNTSIWFVNYSDQTTHMIYPKGQSKRKTGKEGESYVGITHRDMSPNGSVELTAEDGGKYLGYQDWFKAKMGLVVRDWRYNVRIANIDKSVIANMGNENYTGPDLINEMIRAYNRIEDMDTGKNCIYVNRDVLTAIDLNIANKKTVAAFNWGEIEGKRVRMFREIPVKLCDAILNTEERVI